MVGTPGFCLRQGMEEVEIHEFTTFHGVTFNWSFYLKSMEKPNEKWYVESGSDRIHSLNILNTSCSFVDVMLCVGLWWVLDRR